MEMQSQTSRIENNTERQSCFELLRLISMFFIVLYHFLRWFVQDNPLYSELKALWLPLHVGVICFVLISGFFRIKPSSRGFVRLISMVLVYSLPGIIVDIRNAGNWYDVVHSLLFISHTKYWFVRTYIGLFLLSPLINTFWDHSSNKGRWYLLVVTGIVSVYLGCFSKYYLYEDGKNLINFLFLYQVGQMLSFYSSQWKKTKVWKLLVAYMLLNVLLVVGYYRSLDTTIGELLWKYSFPYSSPVLLVNSVLLFMIVGHLSFQSNLVNHLSAGVFAVYLIHGSVPLASDFQRQIVSNVFSISGNNFMFVGILVVMALVAILLCLIINQLLSPVWILSRRLGDWMYNKLGF